MSSSTVRIAENKIWVDRQPVSLISGEVHYWRLDPHNWPVVLRRVKEMGLDVVATYVCWEFHEIEPGRYDFAGETDPRRNLVGFLDLLQREGFWIIFRPGPYIYSEWKNGGVPDYAAKHHRLDPDFLTLAQPYMRAVTEVAIPYLATRGGRIILWQADNEIDPWPHLYTEELGLGRKVGPFHDYLRERYHDVEALNAAWGTSCRSIDEARAVSELFPNSPALLARYHGYRSFIHWYVNQVAACAVDSYRALGVDVPIYLNAYSGVGTQRWADLEGIADLAGPDIYPSNEFRHRGQEHRNFLEAVRYSRTFSRLPYIPEFQAGIWHEWLQDVGTLTPGHYRLMCISALLGGASGWNWYMIVNRDNWYQSPINEWGRIRPDLFGAFQQMTRLFREVDPTTLVKQTATAVTFDPLQRSAQRPGQDLLQSFYDADIDYEFFDLSQDRLTGKPLVFYAGGQWLPAASQQRLVEYVEGGGHLVCLGAYPEQDEHLKPLNLLDIPAPSGVVSGSPGKLHLSLLGGIVESPWIHSYDDVPGEPVIAERLPIRKQPAEELSFQFSLQNGACYTVGYILARGKGRVTVIGLAPSPELLLVLHRQVGIPLASRSLTPDVSTALFRRAGDLYLFAANAGAEGKAAEIELDPHLVGGQTWRVQNVMTGSRSDMAGRIVLSLPAKDGAVLRLAPVEQTEFELDHANVQE